MALTDIKRDEYGTPVVGYDTTGETFLGNTTMDDVQIQEHANGGPINPELYAGYHNHGPVDTRFSRDPGEFLTNKPGQIVYHAQARVISASGVVALQTVRIAGVNFVETSGSATATIVVSQGIDGNQQPLMFINLTANESMRDFPPLPIESPNGVYVTITGAAKGIVYTEESRNV